MEPSDENEMQQKNVENLLLWETRQYLTKVCHCR